MKLLPGTTLSKNFLSVKWTVKERVIHQSLNKKGQLEESVVLVMFTQKGAKKIIHEKDAIRTYVQRDKAILK